MSLAPIQIDVINNPLTHSVFNYDPSDGNGSTPVETFKFQLLSGNNFQLVNGNNFELLAGI